MLASGRGYADQSYGAFGARDFGAYDFGGRGYNGGFGSGGYGGEWREQPQWGQPPREQREWREQPQWGQPPREQREWREQPQWGQPPREQPQWGQPQWEGRPFDEAPPFAEDAFDGRPRGEWRRDDDRRPPFEPLEPIEAWSPPLRGPAGPERDDMRPSRPQPFMDDSDDSSLIHRFQHCAHLLMHRRGRQSGRARALMVLAGDTQGRMSQRELADRLDIRSASMSELLAKMEESGLIARKPDPHDRRAVLVELTQRGVNEAKRIKERRQEENERLFSVLDDDEKDQLEETLDKLSDFWHEEIDSETQIR